MREGILALNAAVEAARAGKQGRGFGVVAGEVRTLARRSATAAKEIKDLIGDSVNRVDVGSKLVDEAGSTINGIVQSVKRVTDIMGEISSAPEEQSTGIEQVNQAVSQMDQMTQQNATLVEEAAAATQSMTQQAQGLREAVAVFKLSDTGSSAPRVIDMATRSNRLAVDLSSGNEQHRQVRPVDAISDPNATSPNLALTDQICLTLFGRWCEQRNVVVLAYLMHGWPLLGNAPSLPKRLLQSLRELKEYHHETLLSEELTLLGSLLTNK